MNDSVIVVSISALYLFTCLAIGMRAGGKTSDTAAGYVAGDRAIGPVVMYFITGATIFSAFAFLGAPARAYTRGAAALFILAYGVFGFLPFYFLGPRAARLGKAFGFVTQAELVAARFRLPVLAGAMALISVLAFVPYLALQMSGAGIVLHAMTEGAVPEWAGAALVYGIVLVYVLKSGVLGVGWTNTFQGVFMMVMAWALGLYLPYHLYGGVGAMFERIATERPELLQPPGLTGGGGVMGWGDYTSTLIVTAIGFSFWPHLFMKAYTARDERTLRRTVVLYPSFQLFLVPIFLLGFAGVLFEPAPERGDQILPHMLMSLELSPVVVGLFCAGGLAASMSSGDAMVHATASIVVRDGLVTGLGRELTPQGERRLIRIVLVAVTAGAYLVAVLYRGNLVDLLVIFAYGPVVQFAPGVVAALYVRRATGIGVLAGMAAGIVGYLVFVRWPELRPFELHAGGYGLVANVLVMAAVSAVTSPRDPEDQERFLDIAGRPS